MPPKVKMINVQVEEPEEESKKRYVIT
jgi:hypothetical protein